MKKEKVIVKEKVTPMIRINTRIRQDQHRFIKLMAKTTNTTEGECYRAIVDDYMKKLNKKKK